MDMHIPAQPVTAAASCLFCRDVISFSASSDDLVRLFPLPLSTSNALRASFILGWARLAQPRCLQVEDVPSLLLDVDPQRRLN